MRYFYIVLLLASGGRGSGFCHPVLRPRCDERTDRAACGGQRGFWGRNPVSYHAKRGSYPTDSVRSTTLLHAVSRKMFKF
jgi:hypothetical protein